MKKVFLDTNVVLDLFTGRDGAEDAGAIFQLGEDGEIDICISFLTVANCAYILRKLAPDVLHDMLKELTGRVEVLSMDAGQIVEALKVESPDFEDMLQYQCALFHGCNCIITRNIRHFGYSVITVMAPNEFLGTILR